LAVFIFRSEGWIFSFSYFDDEIVRNKYATQKGFSKPIDLTGNFTLKRGDGLKR
jgi:hypothetical protein